MYRIIPDYRPENSPVYTGFRRRNARNSGQMERRIHNPWAGGRMTVDIFWIDGGRRHCSGFVLGPFCSISHDSTLRRKGQTNPTIHSQVFAFVLARGGCGRGASALPLNASVSSLIASARRSFLLLGV